LDLLLYLTANGTSRSAHKGGDRYFLRAGFSVSPGPSTFS